MSKAALRVARWAALVAFTAALAACGGGGGEWSAGPLPAPRPDERSGTYVMVAADAREYALTLDFRDATWRVVGTGVDATGTFAASGDAFVFQPGNGIGATGFATTRFTVDDDAVVGEFLLPTGAQPFIAARDFHDTVAGAAGVYNFLGRVVDTTGAADTTIQQAEITAAGTLRTCEDAAIREIANCPPGSVDTATLTVADEVFTATIGAASYRFRVAEIGGSKVFLRATASTGSTRRFIVGLPAGGSFAAGSFLGGTTQPAWGTVAFGNGRFDIAGTTPTGVASNVSGTTRPTPGGGSLDSLLLLETVSSGSFFATRSGELAVLVAARGQPVAPGYMAIGRAR